MSILIVSARAFSCRELLFGIGVLLAVAGALVSFASSAHAASARGTCPGGTVFVDRDASGSNNGSSWPDAFVDLQDALSVDAPCEIWIAEGVYVPSTDPNDRTATFQLQNGIALYGGFDGTETRKQSRDWKSNATVLSGDIGGDDPSDANGILAVPSGIVGGNSIHVVTGSSTDATARLDGVIVTAGDADGSLGSPTNCTDACGGGMFAVTGAPTLANISFIGNRASGDGGGMFLRTLSAPTLVNIEFGANLAGRDGGGLASFDSAPTLVNSVFNGNSANRRGGALWVNRGFADPEDGRPSLINATFSANRASDIGGGIYNASGSDPRLINTIVWNNQDNSGVGTGSSSIVSVSSSPVIAFSLIQGQNPAGDGNLDGTDSNNAPGFRTNGDPANAPAVAGNLRLTPGSVAIDVGDPATDLALFSGGPSEPVDFDGNPRVDPDGLIDIGAFEFKAGIFVDRFESDQCDVGTACDDGSLCTINDSCQPDGSCQGTPKCTADGQLCRESSCDEETGTCSETMLPDGTA
ncbi:MAG: choice-of-anchor Q domain-containing protein, partial [Wenzhouxiangella sp.]|nr:choice-of-anchor Q domain-containing protein [Wenzhouxiangella sp.]